jgi:hypothetical protein
MDRPILNDADGMAGHLYGATNTPHMFVIDKDQKIAYMGAIDNDSAWQQEGQDQLRRQGPDRAYSAATASARLRRRPMAAACTTPTETEHVKTQA